MYASILNFLSLHEFILHFNPHIQKLVIFNKQTRYSLKLVYLSTKLKTFGSKITHFSLPTFIATIN